MLEVQDASGKVVGYVDGKQYSNAKKKAIGVLEGNTYKAGKESLLKVDAAGDICMCEYEDEGDVSKPGSLKDGKILTNLPTPGTVMYQFDKAQGAILAADNKVVLKLKGAEAEINRLTDMDIFGIAAAFLEIFS